MVKGVALPTRTVVIIVLLLLVLAVLAYFFVSSSRGFLNPISNESSINKYCSEWRYWGYSYSKFNTTNYPSLVNEFGNPVRAKDYCMDLSADIDIVDCTSESSKCSYSAPTGFDKCCCEDIGGDGDCDDGETNCGWGTSC